VCLGDAGSLEGVAAENLQVHSDISGPALGSCEAGLGPLRGIFLHKLRGDLCNSLCREDDFPKHDFCGRYLVVRTKADKTGLRPLGTLHLWSALRIQPTWEILLRLRASCPRACLWQCHP
jgi:hypothetical protein